jgi:hypothetical protein
MLLWRGTWLSVVFRCNPTDHHGELQTKFWFASLHVVTRSSEDRLPLIMPLCRGGALHVWGFIVGRYGSGMGVAAFRSHLAGPDWFLNVASRISVKLWSTHCWSRMGPVPSRCNIDRPVSVRCLPVGPSPTSPGRRYWTGMGAAPSPTRVLVGVPVAPSPTHTVQFLLPRAVQCFMLTELA